MKKNINIGIRSNPGWGGGLLTGIWMIFYFEKEVKESCCKKCWYMLCLNESLEGERRMNSGRVFQKFSIHTKDEFLY